MQPLARHRRAAADRIKKLLYPRLRDAFAIASHVTVSERIALHDMALGAAWNAEIGSYDAMSEGSRDTWATFSANPVWVHLPTYL